MANPIPMLPPDRDRICDGIPTSSLIDGGVCLEKVLVSLVAASG
jgi:hypothetical protein